MFKRILSITSLSMLNMPLYAMDLNETTAIIEEATKATQGLQDKFQALIDEPSTPATIEALEVVPSITINKNGDINQTTLTSDNNRSNVNLGTSSDGLLLYKTKIKPYCKITGDKFAKQYTQEDWEDIYHEEEFKMELLKACPKLKEKYEEKWTPDLYQFALEYASDSDAIPEC